MKKIKGLDEENIEFFEAVRLAVMIREKKMTLKSLRAEVPERIVSLLKSLEWIVVNDENSEIEITPMAQEYMTEYHAMIILGNINNRMRTRNDEKGMRITDLERNVPKKAVDFLKGNALIVIVDEVVYATERGKRELKEYFKKEE